MIKTAIIKKLPSGKYRLYSKSKGKDGRRKNLGTYDSLKAVKEREGQIQFFKGHGADDQYALDSDTKLIKDISEVAQYLERAGYIKEAEEMYAMMNIDGSLEDYDLDQIPDSQLNTENEGHLGGSGMGGYDFPGPITVALLKQLVKTANEFDEKGLAEEADELDELLKELIEEYEQDNVDQIVGVNGLVGSSLYDNQNVGMSQIFSDSYLYSGYEQQEGAYDHPKNRSGPDIGYNREELQRKLTL